MSSQHAEQRILDDGPFAGSRLIIIKNDCLELGILPEHGGRIIRMLDQASGMDIINPIDLDNALAYGQYERIRGFDGREWTCAPDPQDTQAIIVKCDDGELEMIKRIVLIEASSTVGISVTYRNIGNSPFSIGFKSQIQFMLEQRAEHWNDEPGFWTGNDYSFTQMPDIEYEDHSHKAAVMLNRGGAGAFVLTLSHAKNDTHVYCYWLLAYYHFAVVSDDFELAPGEKRTLEYNCTYVPDAKRAHTLSADQTGLSEHDTAKLVDTLIREFAIKPGPRFSLPAPAIRLPDDEHICRIGILNGPNCSSVQTGSSRRRTGKGLNWFYNNIAAQCSARLGLDAVFMFGPLTADAIDDDFRVLDDLLTAFKMPVYLFPSPTEIAACGKSKLDQHPDTKVINGCSPVEVNSVLMLSGGLDAEMCDRDHVKQMEKSLASAKTPSAVVMIEGRLCKDSKKFWNLVEQYGVAALIKSRYARKRLMKIAETLPIITLAPRLTWLRHSQAWPLTVLTVYKDRLEITDISTSGEPTAPIVIPNPKSTERLKCDLADPYTEPAFKSVDIGSRIELFCDGWLVDTMKNASLKLHSPIPRDVVLKRDKPWEDRGFFYCHMLKDIDKYRLYYRADGSVLNDALCYAESTDAIHWTKPSLGICRYEGSGENNIIMHGGRESQPTHNMAVFKDPRPEIPDNERYKAVGGIKTLHAFVSHDGLHWNKMHEHPIVHAELDSLNTAFWDPSRSRYMCYFRKWHNDIRDIACCTSDDFTHWSEPVFLDYGETPPDQFYTNAVTPYFRAPHIYLGFPKRFVVERRAIPEHKFTGVSDAVFMCSRDGIHWKRYKEAFIRPGCDRKNWVERNMMVSWGILPLSDTEISLYYSEHNRHPDRRLRRATLRTDGFVSVNADADGGECLTRPFSFSGDHLVINYSTSAAGSIAVEICDASGGVVPGYAAHEFEEIFGDEIARTVRWNKTHDVSGLVGKEIRLRFIMKDADLYSIRFAT